MSEAERKKEEAANKRLHELTFEADRCRKCGTAIVATTRFEFLFEMSSHDCTE